MCSDVVYINASDVKEKQNCLFRTTNRKTAVMLQRRVRQSDQDFPHTTNTNLLVHENVEVCRITALDGEQSLFRSLPKNCIEKNPQFSGDFAESVVMLSC